MAIPKKVINYLEKEGFNYEAISHKTAYTAWDISQTKRISPKEIVKALVLRIDRDYVLALLPADRNLDRKKFLKTVNAGRKKMGGKIAKRIDFAKEAWMKKNVFGKPGAVPPFGGLLNMKIYADNSILKNKKLYLGSGDYETSISVKLSDYVKREEIEKGNFSMAKKIKKSFAKKDRSKKTKKRRSGCGCCRG
ncbi:MAG: YbaK/EbsC family protein [Candidatus Moranbacteria bacterium]|jgi:prolyl-tRNA editing enzyme YbaK/EbsC (Cys-tRNA(Pro) deacylase)|nr:YbaK/EbsC family protein [Candidatus Moranbacteria bacterium]MDD5652079.1 YbaK/EbsC family protein [Candidatus Moranbacteria bacterium]MDX9855674.1 YbaK/EbsC family protein [Candidatus Moranbacteria bacterium]